MPPGQGTGLLLRREHVVNASLVGAVVVVVGFASGLGVQQVAGGGQSAVAAHSPRTGTVGQTPQSNDQTPQSNDQTGQPDQSMSGMVGASPTDSATDSNASMDFSGFGGDFGGPDSSGYSGGQSGQGNPPSSGSGQPLNLLCGQGAITPALQLVTNTVGGVVGTVSGVTGPLTQSVGQVTALPLPLGGVSNPLPGATGPSGAPGAPPVCPAPAPALLPAAPNQPTPISAAPAAGLPVSVLGGGQ